MVAARAGIAVGMNAGHVVTKREKVARPASRKGVSSSNLQSGEDMRGGQRPWGWRRARGIGVGDAQERPEEAAAGVATEANTCLALKECGTRPMHSAVQGGRPLPAAAAAARLQPQSQQCGTPPWLAEAHATWNDGEHTPAARELGAGATGLAMHRR